MKVNIAKWPKRAVAAILAVLLAITFLPFSNFNLVTAKAAAGDVPAHDKVLTVNDDGTYTIALNVTGDSEKNPQKVNVIVIVDRSNSMDTQSGTGAYVASNQNGTNMYGLVDGEYVALTRVDHGWGTNPRYTYTVTSTGEAYTGQRYQYDYTATRMQATRAAVDGLSSTLLSYNGKDGNPNDTVEMALVDFATAARTVVDETTDTTTFVNAVNGISPPGGNAGGTNWEMALRQADTINFGDNDPTYVIFFSDGAPTFYGTGPSGTGGEQEPNMSNSYNAATDEAAALAAKVGKERFYTIFAYGSSAGQTYMTNLTAAAGAPAENNYSASSTAELQDAFAQILEAIEMAGIGAVSMEDGTTSSVTTTSGDVSHLLTVDESSYKYYRAGGNYSDINDYDPDNGEYGAEWTDAPSATFEDGAVKWDLAEEGVLENGVTYTVTFDCWPSQTTLDIAADIKNDPSSYDSLDANIKKYINPDGSLKTNTTASLSYKDTREDPSNEHTETYVNPDPVTTSAIEQLAVTKEWENALDGQKAEPITLTVTRDDDPHYTMTLGEKDPDTGEAVWTDNIFISIGILRHSDSGTETDSAGAKYEVLEKGHNFTFEEPSDLGYYWELEVPTVRPMLIDGTLTMLILKETKAPYNNPNNTTEYTIDNKTYYTGDTGVASLTAVNHRRARLNITKVVNGEAADPAQTFPFTVTVNDSKASEGSESNLNSDYWVWFSVWNGGYVDCVTSDVNKEYDEETGEWTGYYYVKSGTPITLDLKAGDNLRFLNLPTESTYTITEDTLPANYAFTSSVLTTGVDEGFVGAQTTTGTIVETETDYTVTYTNTYALTNVEITKVWDDANNQDGLRPTVEQFKSYLVLKADGTDVTSANADKLTVTVDSADANKYIVKWTGLDRYASGEEITYTVEEKEIPNYTTTGSPAVNGGTITNKHIPQYTEATVVKVWDDANNQDGKRPTELKVTLSNGTEVTLNAENQWTAKVENLPKYSGGQEIEYTWTEGTMPEGYSLTNTKKEGTVTTLTNSYTPELTEATVKKVWDDANNQDGKRPESLTVTLSNGTTVTLNAANDWTAKVENLPKYSGGQEIQYTWTEGELPEGYELTDTSVNGTVTTLTNTHVPETTEATVVKVWDDAENQDGKRPTELKVTLSNGTEVTLNEGNQWTATVPNLPKYANGTEIQYSWTEGDLPEGYELTGTSVNGTITTLTNSYEPETTEATVKKVWNDADNQDGKRPTSLTVQLNANGKAVDGKTVTLNAANDWTDTLEGLPVYESGTAIKYTWTESELPTGYTLTDTSVNGTITTLTNSYTPENIKIAVKKVWDDSENKYGSRPATLAVTLHNGTEGEEQTYNLSQNNNWTITLEVPKYANGQVITYTWTEDTVPAGYELLDPEVTTADDGTVTTTLTNKLKFGDLIIEKDLSTFQHFEGQDRFVTIVFHVQATLNGKPVFDKYIPVQMEGASVSKIEILKQIPVGATVTITEEYEGAGYSKVKTEPDPPEVTIVDPDEEEAVTAKVTFENTYTDQRDGYGIVNQYSNDGTGWSVEQKDPAKKSSDDSSAEPED